MNDYENDPRLAAFVLGELDAEQSARFEQEIAATPELAREVESLRASAAWLAESVGGSGESACLSTDRVAEIFAASRRTFGLRARLAPHARTAAAVLAIVGVGGLLTGIGASARRGAPAASEPAGTREVLPPAFVPSILPANPDLTAGLLWVQPEPTFSRSHVGFVYDWQDSLRLPTVGLVQLAQNGQPDTWFGSFTPESRLPQQVGAMSPALSTTTSLAAGFSTDGSGIWGGVDVPRPHIGEDYASIREAGFVRSLDQPLATFGMDVDTASYSNVRRYLQQLGQLPPRDAVRLEEFVNAFPYEGVEPEGPHPLEVRAEVAAAPWKLDHRLVRVTVRARTVPITTRPRANLVFLLDVSGSMADSNKLPLVRKAMTLLAERLEDQDRVAIVTYAGQAGLALESTLGRDRASIVAAVEALQASGSTNGGAGIEQAYEQAQRCFVPGGINRVILATDGDFNVGVTAREQLLALIEEKARSGVFLSVLGFGMGNLKDSTLEMLANRGNGVYGYVDTEMEARRLLVDQMGGSLLTVAKDCKIQVEFNPALVESYRLLGYENRGLAPQQFDDDRADGGEVGSGQTVTAFFEIAPRVEGAPVDPPLRYRSAVPSPPDARASELLTVAVRYQWPDAPTSTRFEVPVRDGGQGFDAATRDFRFSTVVAAFAMILRGSPHARALGFGAVEEIAKGALGPDATGQRAEFVELVRKARSLLGDQ